MISFSSCILARLFFKFCNTRVQLGLPRAEKLDLLQTEIRFLQPGCEDKDGVKYVEEWLGSNSSGLGASWICSKDTLLLEQRFLSVQIGYCKKFWKRLCNLNNEVIPLWFSPGFECKFGFVGFEPEPALWESFLLDRVVCDRLRITSEDRRIKVGFSISDDEFLA